ncbi:MAG: nitrile hydratase accessory protein [SAR324 cluster bacterium]|nr:nitrile hydratase accessory protein [SAR324 cluster bacterium]
MEKSSSVQSFKLLPAQPRDEEGPVFKEPWEAQAFSMTLRLFEQGCFSWKEWAEFLSAEISAAHEEGDPDLGDTYYHHWLAALEKILADKGVLHSEELIQRKKEWENAVLRTEHGKPIRIEESQIHAHPHKNSEKAISEHPYIETIRRYYHGCNTADVALIRSTFTEDVVHYFTHAPPVRGGDALAHFWSVVAPKYKYFFVLDHGIVQGMEAVIEWTLNLTPKETGEPELIRGTEWYIFRDNRIAEVRAYYLNRHAPYPQKNFELLEFPYQERGYSFHV